MIILETNKGAIKIELDTMHAPKTCENFLQYVSQGFYDNTIFHRVINGFMVQGGGFEADLIQKTAESPIENEADKTSSNRRGTIAMARTSDPHSATAQFFINVADNVFLDFKDKTLEGWGYCVFGRVVDGMDVIDEIKNVKTTSKAGHQDVPEDDVIITKVKIEDNESS